MKEIDETRLRRLPPPPLFTLRPPPKPPGKLFDHFQSGEIFNGQCQRPTLTSIYPTNESTFTWLNLFLLLMAILSIICCFIIVIFIYICLKKLKKEEKQYRNYLMSDTLSLRHARPTLIEHYHCPSRLLNDDSTQIHQYECIPEYFLTYPRRHVKNDDEESQKICTCSPRIVNIDDIQPQIECSTPLLSSSTIVGWTRRNSSLNHHHQNDDKHSSCPQWRKSSLLE